MADEPCATLTEWDRQAIELGSFLMAWKPLERVVTMMSLAMHRFAGGDRSEPKGPPRAFGRKVTMIEQCIETDPRLEAHKKVGAAMVNAWRMLAGERDFLIHHVEMEVFEDLPPVRLMLDRVPWPKPPNPPDIRGLDGMSVAELTDHVIGTVEISGALMVEMCRLIMPDQGDRPTGEGVG